MFETDILFRGGWEAENTAKSVVSRDIIAARPGGEVLIPREGPLLPESPFYSGSLPDDWEKIVIGYIGRHQVLLAMAPFDAEAPGDYEWRSPRTLFAGLTPALVGALSRASMLATWDYDYRFCGRCGTKTYRDADEPARICPSCAHRSYPRVSPAMIVLIEASAEAGFAEPRILLAHNRRFPDGVYSCLAGYVDAGENLETTVCREVMEEVGLTISPPVYVRSQSWPQPHALMLGFRTTAFGIPVPDCIEISDAQWFSAADLPRLPRPGAIARTLIDDWLKRTGAEPVKD